MRCLLTSFGIYNRHQDSYLIELSRDIPQMSDTTLELMRQNCSDTVLNMIDKEIAFRGIDELQSEISDNEHESSEEDDDESFEEWPDYFDSDDDFVPYGEEIYEQNEWLMDIDTFDKDDHLWY